MRKSAGSASSRARLAGVRDRNRHRLTLFLTALVALPTCLAACADDSPVVDPAATVLPTPTQRADDAADVLGHQVRDLLRAPGVVVDEDLQYGPGELEVRLTWGAHGSVVDASSLPLSRPAPPGTEVFRSPRLLLQRRVGDPDACWSPGGDEAARFDRPVLDEVAVLRSAQATSTQDGLLVGSLAARPVLGLLGSDEQLRGRGLEPPAAGARVPATFTTDDGALLMTLGWGSVAEAGGAKRASGTWTLRYRVFGATGPAAPTADMMCP
jgi:hypothetical protein